MKKKILIINGPNLNMLGKREPEVYGKTTLKELEKKCLNESKKLDLDISFFQSNSEAEIITYSSDRFNMKSLKLLTFVWSFR